MTAEAIAVTTYPVTTLTYPVLLTQQGDGTWMAHVAGWIECQVIEGTREEALKKIQQRLADQLKNAELVQVEVPIQQAENPWMKLAGKYKDDPMFEEMMAEIEQERREEYAQQWGNEPDEGHSQLEAC